MPETRLTIPQIGEGLQEARIVAFLKQPGDWVNRDESVYQMETDKAVMDVESPVAGRVVSHLAAPDDLLPIGAEVMVLDTEAAAGDPAPAPAPAAPAQVETSGPEDEFHSLVVPQIGEGLQEARIVAFHKQPGDLVARDEAIYQIETDKAVMDIESPAQGILMEWLAAPDDVLPIGGEVGRLKLAGPAPAPAPLSHAPAPAHGPVSVDKQAEAAQPHARRRLDIPPKTRAYAKEKGLTEYDLAALPATGKNLLPADVDSYLAGRETAKPKAGGAKPFVEAPLANKQRILASRLVRGSQLVVPGMMSVSANWGPIEELREEIKAGGGDFQPSTFTMFAYCVAKAAAKHPIVRSTLIGDATVRTYEHLQLGIAVSLPGDELVVAVVEDSDAQDWRSFAQQAREKISLARNGRDQANETVTLSITNMAGYGIRDAMAVVVPPGVATIFLGEAHWGLHGEGSRPPQFARCANIGITIDHRLINGVGGAEFLNQVKANVENVRELISL